MIKEFFSLLFAKYIVFRNSYWISNAVKTQEKTMFSLIKKAKNTQFGKDFMFSKISSYKDFREHVPIKDYEGIKHYVDRVISGEENILWPGKPLYFCKTSGTTSGIKYIPISKSSIKNHIRSARDSILYYINETKDASIVSGKMIFIQGSPVLEKTNGVLTGRLSGIVAHHVPFYLKKNSLPSFKTNSVSDWEKKIDSIVVETRDQKMSVIGGIPPWVKMYFEKLISSSEKKIKDVFPFFNLFIYGGVSFNPYKNLFDSLIGKKIGTIEVYPASEGFIAYQNSQKDSTGLLLCVNNGIFYEFIEVDSFFSKNQKRFSLSSVELEKNYVLILNTNSGLWGYNIGDTIRFVSLDPYKIIITGRIGHFTSAFGEHVITEEVESSLKEILDSSLVRVSEFHVAPQVSPVSGLPYHEWFIEFEKAPEDLDSFSKDLDFNLQKRNSYYKDLISGSVLRSLKITVMKKNSFVRYMDSIGRLGGQNKIPRLSNNRVIACKLLKFV